MPTWLHSLVKAFSGQSARENQPRHGDSNVDRSRFQPTPRSTTRDPGRNVVSAASAFQSTTVEHNLLVGPDTRVYCNLIVAITAVVPAAKRIGFDLEPNRGKKKRNYTRHGSNGLLGLEGCHRNASGAVMAARVSNKSDTDTEKSQLSKQDTRILLVLCTELVNLCARLTGKIDPAAGAMLAYVRDDIVAENKNELQ